MLTQSTRTNASGRLDEDCCYNWQNLIKDNLTEDLRNMAVVSPVVAGNAEHTITPPLFCITELLEIILNCLGSATFTQARLVCHKFNNIVTASKRHWILTFEHPAKAQYGLLLATDSVFPMWRMHRAFPPSVAKFSTIENFAPNMRANITMLNPALRRSGTVLDLDGSYLDRIEISLETRRFIEWAGNPKHRKKLFTQPPAYHITCGRSVNRRKNLFKEVGRSYQEPVTIGDIADLIATPTAEGRNPSSISVSSMGSVLHEFGTDSHAWSHGCKLCRMQERLAICCLKHVAENNGHWVFEG